MKRINQIAKKSILICTAICAAALLGGCAPQKTDFPQETPETPEILTETGSPGSSLESRTAVLESASSETDLEQSASGETTAAEPPAQVVADWSGYFGEMNGAAVVYELDKNRFRIYNQELADTRRSPCSTFKIISSLVGLETGVISSEDSTRKWSGETFWNEDWNRDISFDDAFRTSCVWYFRQVIDDIGKEAMETALEKLRYGNQDISDWEGIQNTNNSNRALTGFWIESSLKISPREQAEVMERIFGRGSGYSEETLLRLEQVMLLSEQPVEGIRIYGKTGMGKDRGVTVDAWYTGFADVKDTRVYFCVYLGESPGADVTSAKAREIAVQILQEEN